MALVFLRQNSESFRRWSISGLREVDPSPRAMLPIWMSEANLMTLEPEMAISQIGQLRRCLDQCELAIHMAEMIREEQVRVVVESILAEEHVDQWNES